jgi:hypothetical protein
VNTEEMIIHLRSLLSESNLTALDDRRDLLTSLNRAQDYAADIVSRKYQEPLLRSFMQTLEPMRSAYPLPKQALSGRLQLVEIQVSGIPGGRGTYLPCKRISFKEVTYYESQGTTPYPTYYYIKGNQVHLLPTPSGSNLARFTYTEKPPKLVLPYGRVTGVQPELITLDVVRNAPGTTVDDLSAFANVIDPHTGEIKATVQMINVDEEFGEISFSDAPTRTTVLGRTVSPISEVEIEEDDYLCSVEGSCFSVIGEPAPNFLIAHAHADLTRVLGGAHEVIERLKKDFERQLASLYAVREPSMRVRRVKSPRMGNWSNIRGRR